MARLNTAAVVGQTTTASWANYFGGSGMDQGTGMALDVNQNAYFAGDTNSTDLHVAKALQSNNNGGYDAFVTQLGTAVSLSINGVLTLGTNQTFISAGNPATFTYTVTNNGPDLASNITVTDNLSSAVTSVPLTFVSAATSSGTCGGSFDQCRRELQPSVTAVRIDGNDHHRGNAHSQQRRKSVDIQWRFGAGDGAGQHRTGGDLGAGVHVGL